MACHIIYVRTKCLLFLSFCSLSSSPSFGFLETLSQFYLCAQESRSGIFSSIQCRNLNETRNTSFSSSFGNKTRTFYVNIIESEVPKNEKKKRQIASASILLSFPSFCFLLSLSLSHTDVQLYSLSYLVS